MRVCGGGVDSLVSVSHALHTKSTRGVAAQKEHTRGVAAHKEHTCGVAALGRSAGALHALHRVCERKDLCGVVGPPAYTSRKGTHIAGTHKNTRTQEHIFRGTHRGYTQEHIFRDLGLGFIRGCDHAQLGKAVPLLPHVPLVPITQTH